MPCVFTLMVIFSMPVPNIWLVLYFCIHVFSKHLQISDSTVQVFQTYIQLSVSKCCTGLHLVRKWWDVSCVDSLHIPYIVKFLYENISLGDEKYSQNVWTEKHAIWLLRSELIIVQLITSDSVTAWEHFFHELYLRRLPFFLILFSTVCM